MIKYFYFIYFEIFKFFLLSYYILYILMYIKIFNPHFNNMIFSHFSDTSILFHRGRQRGMQLRIYILACLLFKGVSEITFFYFPRFFRENAR